MLRRIALIVLIFVPAGNLEAQPDPKRIAQLVSDLRSQDVADRVGSAQELALIGPEARAAVPALISVLNDSDECTIHSGPFSFQRRNVKVREAAFEALATIGMDAVPALSAAILNDNDAVCEAALWSLAKIGPKARVTLRHVEKAAERHNVKIRRAAIEALGAIDPVGDFSIPILRTCLTSDDNNCAEGAVIAIAKFREHPRTIPILLTAMTSTNPAVRGRAAIALGAIGRQREQCIPALLVRLQDDGSYEVPGGCVSAGMWVKQNAIDSLVQFQAASDQVIPEILKDLHDQRPLFARETLHSIPLFQPTPPGTAAAVFQYFERVKKLRLKEMKQPNSTPDFGLEFEAIKCLANLSNQTQEFVPRLREMFAGTDKVSKLEAAALLAAIDSKSNPKALEYAISQIEWLSIDPAEILDFAEAKELRKHRLEIYPGIEPHVVQEMVLSTLCSNLTLAEKMLPKLLTWYDELAFDIWLKRSVITTAFARLGPKAKAAGPSLIADNNNPEVIRAVLALGPEMVPLLILESRKDPYGRSWTTPELLNLIADFGDQALPAVPVLTDFLKSRTLVERLGAVQALGKLRGLPDQVVLELISALRDKRCAVRAAAAHQLGGFPSQADLIIPQLLQSLQDDYGDVRAAAIASLSQLRIKRPEVRAGLERRQQDSNPAIRLLADEALNLLESVVD
ncbi:MAG: putative lyase [Planctomycetaceae bacterium]|nr:putative lyase [Planctomycetaceae bacterium]